jgi:hypothetical protein
MTRDRPGRLEDAVKEALDPTLNVLAHLAKDATNCVDDTARLAHARNDRTDFNAALDCSLCSRTRWMRMSACVASHAAGCGYIPPSTPHPLRLDRSLAPLSAKGAMRFFFAGVHAHAKDSTLWSLTLYM